ncbi:hypothetical protein GPEL0_01f1571 [Geoanaerobacter pelophilus]|uniref:Uncharacterized protein n=1 Tax=Geoanaerobacter pelophilus TaxID=60036 RepID=A0ABQ0MGP5_9BACT|nr:hypothetical protein [Geoanaerobacter pelophilus]GAW66280.1 hypothetical protein GPEL0_01f1571 [Geoanaerobacter pelophilus]
MTPQQQNVHSQLALLHGHAYFRVDEGPLKESITRVILDDAAGDLAEQLSDSSFGLELSVGQQEGESEPTLSYSVDHPGVVYRSEMPLSRLDAEALEDLAKYLGRMLQKEDPAQEKPTSGTVVRKKQEHDHHEQDAAAARLKVSPQWLKSVVPCTEYSYDEIDGKKYIREYYWSRDLIENLVRIKSTKTTPEDLQYVAKECCEGDLDWAKDLIARLKSPNRPEPAPKEQPQKGGQKVQPQARNAGQPQAKQAGQAQAKQAGQPQAKQAAPGERVRSRSRNRKPFRQGGKDGQRKPDQPAAPKPPQG